MHTLLQIFKVDDARKGISAKTGKPWEMQSAQCALLSAEGVLDKVGVLDIPPPLRGKVVPGIFTATFAIGVNFQSGKLEPLLTDLTPVPPGLLGKTASPAPVAAAPKA